MPTYEYRCNACHREFEYQQRMADPDLTTCEACNEDKLEKLISRTAFQLKGGGWYKDLYSSSKPAEPSKESSGTTAVAAPSTDKAAAAPSTDKPAAKTDGGSGGGGTGGTSGGSSGSSSGGGGSSSGSGSGSSGSGGGSTGSSTAAASAS